MSIFNHNVVLFAALIMAMLCNYFSASLLDLPRKAEAGIFWGPNRGLCTGCGTLISSIIILIIINTVINSTAIATLFAD